MAPSCHFAELRYFCVAPLIMHAHVPVLINDVAGRFGIADPSMRQNDVVSASLESLVEKFVHLPSACVSSELTRPAVPEPRPSQIEIEQRLFQRVHVGGCERISRLSRRAVRCSQLRRRPRVESASWGTYGREAWPISSLLAL